MRADLVPPAPHVEGVVPQSLVGGAQVDGQGQGVLGPDAGAGRVEGEFADRNAHAVDAQVSETEDARAVGDDGDLDLVGPVVEDVGDVAAIRIREVHALGMGVDVGPALARLADGRGVYQRSELGDVLG